MAAKRKVKKSKKLDANSEITSHTNMCERCKGKLVKVATEIISNSKYSILKCEKCKHTIARSINEK